MLLRIGVIGLLLCLALAAGIAVLSLQGESHQTTALSSVKPRAHEATQKAQEFNLGQKLEINQEPSSEERSIGQSLKTNQGAAEEPDTDEEADEEATAAESQPEELKPSAQSVPDWPQPTNDEAASTDEPRYFTPDSGTEMTLTVKALGLYNVPVVDSDSVEALDNGLMHMPETSFPWDSGAQRNVYIVGHYLGWPGTASRLIFYNLDKLRSGDKVVLKDRQGQTYNYRVSESFTASPDESWVMGQQWNRDMVTLQTCIPPDFVRRLIVRADRV